MIRVRFSSAAHRDILEAQAWYYEQSSGLDLAFRDELDRALKRVQTFPASCPIVHKSIRRANLRRFPYGVFYVERRDHLFVLGVVHYARSPEHWLRRF